MSASFWKVLVSISLFFWQSCAFHTDERHVILEQATDDFLLHEEELDKLSEPQKALLLYYLLVYGNYCQTGDDFPKCRILHRLSITDECEDEVLAFIKRWMQDNPHLLAKMSGCPVLPPGDPVENRFKKIIIEQYHDTAYIHMEVFGVNTANEQRWQNGYTYRFLVTDRGLRQIFP